MEPRVELINCEATLMEEIANDFFKRDDIAQTYALALRSSERETINWKRVNDAIVARWGLAALTFIKVRAWKIIEGKT